jgi:hypothetical protein
MNNTKWLRRALLSGAALSVMATGAQADELSALKAQLEALQSRVSQLESQPSPQLPAGTKLLTVRKGQGTYANATYLSPKNQLADEQGYTIAVTPTADMPAPVSEVTVSGEIRARMLYHGYEVDGDTIDLNADDTTEPDVEEGGWEEDDFDIETRGRLRVDGRTETAIGEVGGTIRIEGYQNRFASEPDTSTTRRIELNLIWGYWQMTPNFQLGAGYNDSLAYIMAGWDYSGETGIVEPALLSGPTGKSVSQFRLTYNNGGLTLGVSLEDNNNREADGFAVLNEAVFPAVAGYIQFDTGSFLVTAHGVWEADDTDTTTGANAYVFNDTEDNWMVGIGAILRLSDMFRLEGAASMGEGYTAGTYITSVCSPVATAADCENDMEYWGANALAVISFHEAMRLELGVAYSEADHESDELGGSVADSVENAWSAGASAFWDPVDQLTLGIGVGWTNKESDDGDAESDHFVAGLGAWFRF